MTVLNGFDLIGTADDEDNQDGQDDEAGRRVEADQGDRRDGPGEREVYRR